VARGGGARELALEVGVPIWGIGNGGAHRCGLVAVKQVGGGEPKKTGQRRGGGHQLMCRRGARCQREAQGGSDRDSP
jgi:hypothetical protein